MKKTVVFDFDGVIHSYKSGWKGMSVISDPPVPGIGKAISKLRSAGYEIVVVSTRCASVDGMTAVKQYLANNNIFVDTVSDIKPPVENGYRRKEGIRNALYGSGEDACKGAW